LANRLKANWPGWPISVHSGLVGPLVLARPDRFGRPIGQTDRRPRPRPLLLLLLDPDAPAAASAGSGEPRPLRSPPLVIGDQHSRIYSAPVLDSPGASSGGCTKPLWARVLTRCRRSPMLLRRCSPGHPRGLMRMPSRPSSWRGSVRVVPRHPSCRHRRLCHRVPLSFAASPRCSGHW
jgi:hypothetical protein